MYWNFYAFNLTSVLKVETWKRLSLMPSWDSLEQVCPPPEHCHQLCFSLGKLKDVRSEVVPHIFCSSMPELCCNGRPNKDYKLSSKCSSHRCLQLFPFKYKYQNQNAHGKSECFENQYCTVPCIAHVISDRLLNVYRLRSRSRLAHASRAKRPITWFHVSDLAPSERLLEARSWEIVSLPHFLKARRAPFELWTFFQ